MYPLLHGMESKGFLNSYEQEEAGKVRKYYCITREGSRILDEKREEWKVYAHAVTDVLSMGGAL